MSRGLYYNMVCIGMQGYFFRSAPRPEAPPFRPVALNSGERPGWALVNRILRFIVCEMPPCILNICSLCLSLSPLSENVRSTHFGPLSNQFFHEFVHFREWAGRNRHRFHPVDTLDPCALNGKTKADFIAKNEQEYRNNQEIYTRFAIAVRIVFFHNKYIARRRKRLRGALPGAKSALEVLLGSPIGRRLIRFAFYAAHSFDTYIFLQKIRMRSGSRQAAPRGIWAKTRSRRRRGGSHG